MRDINSTLNAAQFIEQVSQVSETILQKTEQNLAHQVCNIHKQRRDEMVSLC